MIEVERLQIHEGERLRRIRLRALKDAPDAFGSTHEQVAAFPPERWTEQIENLPTFVAVMDGEDVGMVRGALDSACNASAWLISMWVDPGVRGQRIGEALADAVIDWARGLGVSRLLLDVADDNAAAIALYVRKGFVPTGETGTLPAPREHICEHRRALDLSADPRSGTC